MHAWYNFVRQLDGEPMHCGRTADLGGNTIIVHWYRNKTNLSFFGLTKKIVKLFFWINSKTNLHKVPAYNTQLDASCMHGSSYRVILLFNNMLGFQVWDDKAIGTAMNKFYKDDLSTMIGAIKRNLTVSCFCAVLCFTASAILYACQFRIQV
jgi:hypothetical protein